MGRASPDCRNERAGAEQGFTRWLSARSAHGTSVCTWCCILACPPQHIASGLNPARHSVQVQFYFIFILFLSHVTPSKWWRCSYPAPQEAHISVTLGCCRCVCWLQKFPTAQWGLFLSYCGLESIASSSTSTSSR